MTTKTSRKSEMYARIERHGETLLAIFPNATERDPVKLCKKLRRLESDAERRTVAMCNGEGCDTLHEEALTIVENKLAALLGNDPATGVPVFINRDPRGYALKIDDEYVRSHHLTIHRDWGGYGIIAPDLTEND